MLCACGVVACAHVRWILGGHRGHRVTDLQTDLITHQWGPLWSLTFHCVIPPNMCVCVFADPPNTHTHTHLLMLLLLYFMLIYRFPAAGLWSAPVHLLSSFLIFLLIADQINSLGQEGVNSRLCWFLSSEKKKIGQLFNC